MKSNINSQIKKLVLEVALILVFTMVSIPVWDYVSNPTYGEIASHYSYLGSSEVVITNRSKYIYSETYEEAIREMNMAFITSYEEEGKEHDIYLLLKPGTNYDDIIFSNGTYKVPLKDLYYDTRDYIYFKVDSKYLNSKETINYNYYIWSKNLKKDKNIKIKFAVL